MDNSLVLNLDWLAFSVRLIPSPREKDNHGFVLNVDDAERQGFRVLVLGGTNIYACRAVIYYRGAKCMTVLWQPFSRVIPFDSMLCEVANEFLYGRYVSLNGVEFHGLLWALELVGVLHPCQFLCLSRVDLACDFQLSPARAGFVRKLAANEIYVQRASEGSMFHVFDVRDNTVSRWPKQISWGSKRSNIKWKLYNKSLEVFEYVNEGGRQVRHCNKPYIVERWCEAGFDDSNVWRLEVSITPLAKYVHRGRGVQFRDMSNWFFLEDLFGCLYETKFVCRLNQGHKDRSNDKQVWLLGKFSDAVKVKPKETLDSRGSSAYISGLRAAMKQRSLPEVQGNTALLELWTGAAIDCVLIGNLQDYFLHTYGVTIDHINEITEVCVD